MSTYDEFYGENFDILVHPGKYADVDIFDAIEDERLSGSGWVDWFTQSTETGRECLRRRARYLARWSRYALSFT